MVRRTDSASDGPLFAWGDALRAARLLRRRRLRWVAAIGAGAALIGLTVATPTVAYLEDCGIAPVAERRDTLHGVMPWATDEEAAQRLRTTVEKLAGRTMPLA